MASKKEPRPGTKVPDSMKPIPSDRYLTASPKAPVHHYGLGDNSPGYSPGYSRPPKQGDPGMWNSRYVYRTVHSVRDRSGRTTTKSGWTEVPLDYVPKSGELVVQGPAGSTVDMKNPAFRKVPAGGYQQGAAPKSPSGAGYTGQKQPSLEHHPEVAPTSQYDPRIPGRGPSRPQGGATPGLEPRLEQQQQHPGAAGGEGSIPDSILQQLNEIAQGTGLEIDYQPGTAPQIHTPAFPTAPSFDFKRNDFSDEANAAMAKAYGPRYAAIDAAKQSVIDARSRSDEIVKGIYAQLYSDLNSGAAGTKADYDNAATAATQAGTDSAAEIRKSAAGSNADLIAEMKANGLSGPEIAAAVGTGQTDTNAAANQAINAGQANNQYMAAQGKSATDFANTMAGAAQNQGAVSREQLLADMTQAVQGYDAQAMDVAGQQSAQAIGYGQDLSNQDMDIQKMKYGVLSDQYQGNVAGWTAGANNAFQNAGLAMQQQGLNQNAQQFATQQAVDMSKARIAAAQELIKSFNDKSISDADRAEDIRRFDLQFGLDKDKAAAGIVNDAGNLDVAESNADSNRISAEAAAAKAGAGTAAGLDYKDLPGEQQFMAQITNITKDAGVAKTYVDFVNSAVNNDGNLMADTPYGFKTQIEDRAKQAGLDPYIARQVASAFYEHNKLSNPANAVQ